MQFEHNSKEMNIWNNDFGCEAGHSRSTIAWRGLQPTQDPPAGRSWGAPLHRYTATPPRCRDNGLTVPQVAAVLRRSQQGIIRLEQSVMSQLILKWI